MGKMSELDLILKELKEHSDAINVLVNDIYDLFSSKSTDKEEKKEEKKPLTLEEVRSLLASKSRDDYIVEIKALLKKFGANKISKVKLVFLQITLLHNNPIVLI